MQPETDNINNQRNNQRINRSSNKMRKRPADPPPETHHQCHSPWTPRPHCGHSVGAGPRPWCRPCGQRCAGQAVGPCP